MLDDPDVPSRRSAPVGFVKNDQVSRFRWIGRGSSVRGWDRPLPHHKDKAKEERWRTSTDAACKSTFHCGRRGEILDLSSHAGRRGCDGWAKI